MNERELSELLHGVVPEAPRIDPVAVATAGRRSRSRRRLGTALAASVAVVAAVATSALLVDSAPSGEVVAPAFDPADFDPPPDEVYDAVPCPARLPDTRSSNKVLPNLARVVGVRLCGDASQVLDLRGSAASFPATPDALVTGVPSFVAALQALPVPAPERCAAIDGIASRQSLAMEMDDGSTVLLGHEFCGDNLLDGRKVDANSVVQAYLAALDAQRDAQSYGLRLDDFGCGFLLSNSPARPGREHIIEASACPERGPSLRLAPAGLALLQTAWGDPRPVTEELNTLAENTCTELEERPRELTLSTDRGDVVDLYESPCGYLVYRGWEPGGSIQIPVAMDDVLVGSSETPVSSTLDPYGENTCPSPPPAAKAGPKVTVEDVVAVTYCAAFAATPYPLTPEAFVGVPGILQEAIADAPNFPSLECFTLSSSLPGFVTFHFNNGASISVAAGCQRVDIGGTTLLGRQLPDVLLSALDSQRSALHYTLDGEPAACSFPDATDPRGPVEPYREAIADAVGCLAGNKPPVEGFSPETLDLLRQRWALAVPLDATETERCFIGEDPLPGYLNITTDRGDFVQLTRSPCGYFVLSPQLGATSSTYAVPVTLADLGLAALDPERRGGSS